MQPLSAQRLLDLRTVAERTGISARTWRRLIREGAIGVLRIAGTVRVPETALEDFLRERYHPPRPLRRAVGPQEVEAILDRVVPRRRGRPKIAPEPRIVEAAF